ncbi:ubiquitin carboxyl-terminal hydrolase MINDY-3-like [Dreissena polymorpha]|uniref:Ubiquitin carboxyl-terminal hydrolase MINDY n=1 Tax=Dreissena polymorpha TaxID=45954 RepID=A0A9D3YS84_DREPO|nr:ubiquitin carboxyl-terminal hydrolase MINDY-3-like [Dreissena polymorpha]KAH3706078.1 hypothetical protein DPMN_065457 [Dreissena polymorpha]
MAEVNDHISDETIESVKSVLWGNDLKDEVFLRWSQGFIFSNYEPTALVQYEGGPCAVIAPVQAFVIKNALFCDQPTANLTDVKTEESQSLLVSALCDVLMLVSTNGYSVLSLEAEPNSNNVQLENGSPSSNQDKDITDQSLEGESLCKRPRMDQMLFHSRLRCSKCYDEVSLKKCVAAKIKGFSGTSGVLLYLYSVILTKGIEQIKNEVEDISEPLIDGLHGHGSQSLINLLITGKAVTNVWDNDKDISGLKLHGVSRRSHIGFLSFMEHLRYCEVGWNLKNPKYPIWLIGSETHLTVLFSKDTNLIINETVQSAARRIFQRFDPEGNGFIVTDQLGDLMQALDLVYIKEYVDIMASKLDAEGLGIITQSSFFEEFYGGESTPELPKSFTLYHYNGIARSCANKQVQYVEGQAEIHDELEVQIVTDTSPVKFCLLTKWPTIEMKWNNECIPSLN